MTKREIMKAIENMDNTEVINLWNECAKALGRCDKKIHKNGMTFFDLHFDSPFDAVLSVTNGNWRECDKYVAFYFDGTVASFNYCDDEDSPINFNILIDWIFENPWKLKEE